MTDDATRAVLARIDDVRYFVQKATKWNDCAQELANELKVNEALNAMAARIAELEQDAKRTCTWRYMDWPSEGDYDTECGMSWSFSAGTIEDNGVKFCPKCGGKIIPPVNPASCSECGDDIEAPSTMCGECAQAVEEENAAMQEATNG